MFWDDSRSDRLKKKIGVLEEEDFWANNSDFFPKDSD